MDINDNDILDIELGKIPAQVAIRLLIEERKKLKAVYDVVESEAGELSEAVRRARGWIEDILIELDRTCDEIVEKSDGKINTDDVVKITKDLHRYIDQAAEQLDI